MCSFECKMETHIKCKLQEIIEGQAKIITGGKVFYNVVQEFNRDLSISVIQAFVRKYEEEKIKQKLKNKINTDIRENDVQAIIENREPGIKYSEGISVLEALSATGLRSIRYAKEISGLKEIIANDISPRAVDDIKNNIVHNAVEHLVVASQHDAVMLMYQHRLKENQFDIIDLDPYGCPSLFLDSAVQAVKEGGLLLITATDMAVLAGNSPETCYVKYGAVSLKMKACHEMGVRILLQTIESHANRYGRYIEPLLSVSADFYIRVFVRVYSGQYKCKFTTSKLSHVYHCKGCDSFNLQPLGIFKSIEKNEKLTKFCIPTGPPVSLLCEHCNHPHHIGGPIWSAPIHSPGFVQEVLHSARPHLKTYKRIHGVLTMILEELLDVPLYYGMDKIAGILHSRTPPILAMKSALLNAGYKVSYSHMYKNSVKTDAPAKVIWDIMRCFTKQNPLTRKQQIPGTPANYILSKTPEKDYSFKEHPDANPKSRKAGFLRFQENPLPYWGPGSKATSRLHPYHIVLHPALSNEDYDRRLDHCHWMRNMLAEDDNFLCRILWTDEATFCSDGSVNRHNMHYWSATKPHWMREVQHQGRWIVNVWCGILGSRIIGPYIFEQALNGERYLQILENDLPILLEDVPLALRANIFFQHDGCPAHFAVQVRRHLEDHYHDRSIGRGSLFPWPARSPDITCLDFYLCILRDAVHSLPVAEIEAAVMSTRHKMEECIEQDGRHFEHLKRH